MTIFKPLFGYLDASFSSNLPKQIKKVYTPDIK